MATKIPTECRQFRLFLMAPPGRKLRTNGRNTYEETRTILDWAVEDNLVQRVQAARRNGAKVLVDLKWDPPGQEPRWIPIAVDDFCRRINRILRATEPA